MELCIFFWNDFRWYFYCCYDFCIVLPIIVMAGFDPLWFGIFLVFMVELSQITPPVGFSFCYYKGISGEKLEYI